MRSRWRWRGDAEWGDVDSRKKSQQLESTVLSWFSQFKVCHRDIDDLEHLFEENMILSHSTQKSTTTIESVAGQLIIMHEDCLHGNKSITHHFKNKIKTKNKNKVCCLFHVKKVEMSSCCDVVRIWLGLLYKEITCAT